MLFRQFVDEDLGCASYLVGDADAGEALLIDPAYAIEPYLTAADQEGVRIVRVLETHTHADHVSGHGRLALEHDVPRAKVDWGWNWSEVKRALEFLFYAGEISSAGRTTSFERRYAVPERVLPRAVVEHPTSPTWRPSSS